MNVIAYSNNIKLSTKIKIIIKSDEKGPKFNK